MGLWKAEELATGAGKLSGWQFASVLCQVWQAWRACRGVYGNLAAETQTHESDTDMARP
jgi:hypothetical protein